MWFRGGCITRCIHHRVTDVAFLPLSPPQPCGKQYKPMSLRLCLKQTTIPWTKMWWPLVIPIGASGRTSYCNRKKVLNKECRPLTGSLNVSVQVWAFISQTSPESWTQQLLGRELRIQVNVNWHWGVTWGSWKGCVGKPHLFLFLSSSFNVIIHKSWRGLGQWTQ